MLYGRRDMAKRPAMPELNIDIESVLPHVGDRKAFKGQADVELEDGYNLKLRDGKRFAWDLELRRISGGVEVSGALAGTVELQCYRCLASFDYPVELRVREHAVIAPEGPEPADDYADEYQVVAGVLDLEEVFRDRIVLAIPLKRLCDEGCRGLCPDCGADLNSEQCECDLNRVDARLKPLGEFKERLERRGGQAP